MSKQATRTLDFGLAMDHRFTDTALAASRRVWLAGLGASLLARQWARDEARDTLRACVKRGSSVEAQVLRVVGIRINASLAAASSILRLSRKVAASTASALAEEIVKVLPEFMATKPVRRTAATRTRVATKSTKTRTRQRTSRTAKQAK
jgi:hypothetical protein